MQILSDRFGKIVDEYVYGVGITIGTVFIAALMGGCTVGVVEMVGRANDDGVEKPTKIEIPACTEADIADTAVTAFPINVQNGDIGKYVCYVRVIEEGQQDQEEPDDRIELRFRY